jgi:hypothetical protein
VDDFCQRDRAVSHLFSQSQNRAFPVLAAGPIDHLLGDYNSGWATHANAGIVSVCLAVSVVLLLTFGFVPLLVSSEILYSSVTMDSFLKLELIAKN